MHDIDLNDATVLLVHMLREDRLLLARLALQSIRSIVVVFFFLRNVALHLEYFCWIVEKALKEIDVNLGSNVVVVPVFEYFVIFKCAFERLLFERFSFDVNE